MGERTVIPLFPLGLVLVPGLLLPLNVFEERYRTLVRDLLQQDEPRRFGVIAIKQGRETGIDGVADLYDVGTTATVQRVEEQEDGRYELVTVGTERFRLHGLVEGKPYLQGDVEIVDEVDGDGEPAAIAPEVLRVYRLYLDVLGSSRGAEIELPDLPDDPPLLSWLVAATVLVDLPERQRLLAAPSLADRLRAEAALLRRETAILRTVAAAPAPELTRSPQSPN